MTPPSSDRTIGRFSRLCEAKFGKYPVPGPQNERKPNQQIDVYQSQIIQKKQKIPIHSMQSAKGYDIKNGTHSLTTPPPSPASQLQLSSQPQRGLERCWLQNHRSHPALKGFHYPYSGGRDEEHSCPYHVDRCLCLWGPSRPLGIPVGWEEGLYTRKQRSTNVRSPKMRTHEPCRVLYTSETFGRERGSGCQQRCINVHSSPVKLGWLGRGGRAPPIITNITFPCDSALNGTAPVNPCDNTGW